MKKSTANHMHRKRRKNNLTWLFALLGILVLFLGTILAFLIFSNLSAALVIDGHPQQTLFGVGLGQHALDGVVQRRTHEGTQLPRAQKAQLAAVGHAGHVDAALLAVHAFGGQ